VSFGKKFSSRFLQKSHSPEISWTIEKALEDHVPLMLLEPLPVRQLQKELDLVVGLYMCLLLLSTQFYTWSLSAAGGSSDINEI
jgi:hypothetical protein